ncbi:hypothetical protein ACQPYK_08700 [Streptosporangium sp. CA-135522]|uniref:hypothetical protein n=1 Tax=Streptosporangium sp. CA-135522 TaxID=3240072 RepID=UPI003D90728C
MIPLISELAAARRAAGIQQQQIAKMLRLGASAGPSVVSAWESGGMVPNVGHVCGYATTVGRRVIVTRGTQVQGDLLDIVPRLGALRRATGLTQADVAACLYVTPAAVVSAERHAGPRTRLTTARQHLGAAGYALALMPIMAATA